MNIILRNNVSLTARNNKNSITFAVNETHKIKTTKDLFKFETEQHT